MSDFYDKDGSPLEVMEWATLYEDLTYRIVARDEVNGKLVSTVWLGLDHNFLGGRPLIFETMIFPHAEFVRRYSTYEQAKAGHELALRSVTMSDPPPNDEVDGDEQGEPDDDVREALSEDMDTKP